MSEPDQRIDLRQVFLDFAQWEARGVSPLYERLALAVADDPGLLAYLEVAPADQRKATLFFASIHDTVLEQRGSFPNDHKALSRFCRGNRAALLHRIATRRTQTNEVRRASQMVLALAFAGARGKPLALVEVGASAGLNLLLDHYRYRYDTGAGTISIGDPGARVDIGCDFEGDSLAIPERVPQIESRIGLDLDPIDVGDARSARWLRACIWADEIDRLDLLDAAIDVARLSPPRLVRGDAGRDTAALVGAIPSAQLAVVFHQAVLTYVGRLERRFFRDSLIAASAGREIQWFFAEGPGVANDLIGADAEPYDKPVATHLVYGALIKDGRLVSRLLGYADPHGRWIRWLGPGVDGASALSAFA